MSYFSGKPIDEELEECQEYASEIMAERDKLVRFILRLGYTYEEIKSIYKKTLNEVWHEDEVKAAITKQQEKENESRTKR